MLAAEHLGKELAAAIDHIRVFSEIWRCVHHAELDHSCDAIEAAQLGTEGRSMVSPMARGQFSLFLVHVFTDPAVGREPSMVTGPWPEVSGFPGKTRGL